MFGLMMKVMVCVCGVIEYSCWACLCVGARVTGDRSLPLPLIDCLSTLPMIKAATQSTLSTASTAQALLSESLISAFALRLHFTGSTINKQTITPYTDWYRVYLLLSEYKLWHETRLNFLYEHSQERARILFSIAVFSVVKHSDQYRQRYLVYIMNSGTPKDWNYWSNIV